ncbi:MAG: sulfotransferase family 2 domain-containing protein [Pirellulaceae bacterium]|nr:sulfotransferase family 2 domain-containing protein [Pirellulaceae bacterium]
MLLSHSHNFLFVHLAKTGGTSVRAALSSRSWRDPLHWPTFFCHRVSEFCGHRLGCKIPRHAPALVAKELLPPTFFDELFKFSFVRNPWDRVVSAYHHFERERRDVLAEQRIRDIAHFTDWLLDVPLNETSRAGLVAALRRPQIEHLVDFHGNLLVDFVGRYEHLPEDFQWVVEQVAFKGVKLPHKRRSQRPRDYRLSYTDRMAEQVADHFAPDIAAFEYSFDPPDLLEINRKDAAHRMRNHSVNPFVLGRHKPQDGKSIKC